MGHPKCARDGKAVRDRSPDEYRGCAVGDALEHVCPAAYAAVYQHGASPLDAVDNLAKNIKCGGRCIQRASTMVRHDDAAPAMVEDEVHVVTAENPLYQVWEGACSQKAAQCRTTWER
jgi:hypothetical protein